jgi:small subunit ribosomal protein S1
MTNEIIAETLPTVDENMDAPEESFGEAFAQFERTHSHKSAGDAKQLQGTVVKVDAEFVYLDIGFKVEGVLPLSAFPNDAEGLEIGNSLPVSVKGRNAEGYYELSKIYVAQPTDWSALSAAFASEAPVSGVVTGVVKGGFTVDVGMRAFMPASRSGVRDAAEIEKLVGQTIVCKIIKLDTIEDDVVVDRRVIAEAEAKVKEASRYAEIQEGDVVQGTVRSLASYGAFVELGGIDGLLHISDIAWSRVADAGDVLSVGQEVRVKVLKVDAAGKKISLGLKQLEPAPWDSVAEKYKEGERVSGTVTRLMDFGAFVELEPGIEGLVHVSEMSWIKKVRKPSDLLKTGDTVDVLVLKVDAAAKKISLGLKQALGDPWTEVPLKFPVGAEVEGPVTRMMNFGAFVELAEGVEGLVHVSEITAERRINHPSDALRVGEVVKAQVLAVDMEKRQLKLSMKQLVPTGLGEYLLEHAVGDVVSGRVVESKGERAVVELGEGIRAACVVTKKIEAASVGTLDLSAFSSMLSSKWKSGPAPKVEVEGLRVGEIRSFRITAMDADAKKIEVETA